MKTMICIPCMDTMPVEFVKSLINLVPRGEVVPEFLSCSLIYKARNDLAERAIEEKTDYTLWIDSDMVFPSDLLIDLLKDMEGRDIVTGVCHMRRPPYRPCIWKKLKQGLIPEDNVSAPYDNYPKEGIFPVDACGFGCVMVRTSVLKTVIDKYHQACAPLPGYGEDLSFCIRARACGFDIHCDPAIQVGHKASAIVTGKTFEAFRDKGVVL